jgi:Protein of unknown function (DUF3592)
MFPHFHFHFRWYDVFPMAREIVLVGVALAGATVTIYRRWSSFSWPEIEGTVEHHIIGGDEQNVRSGIAYAYVANGEFYSGRLLVALRRQFPTTDEDVKRLYPAGSRVRVRYKPADPSVSVGIPTDVPPKTTYFPPRDDPR